MHELRFAGFSDSASLFWGLKSQGPVILAAGSIMIVAFSGLLHSRLEQLRQIAMFLILGVGWCSVVATPLLTPVLTGMLISGLPAGGAGIWWPSSPPPPRYFESQCPR